MFFFTLQNKIKLAHDIKTGKPRGYAFIEYDDENSMHGKYIF